MNSARWLTALLASLFATPLLAAEPVPLDFAFGAEVSTQGEAAAYRLMLPAEIYQRIVHDDLSDLRIFNGSGEAVPIRLTLPSDAPSARAHAVPIFPLHGMAEANLETLRVTIGERISTLRVQTRDGVAKGDRTLRYVLDARKLDQAVSAITVQWPDNSADFAGRLMVEAGDALGSWRTVVAGAPIANLHANGQQLVERRVQFPGMRAKFWQLSWVGAAAPFELTGASVETAEAADSGVYATLRVAGHAVAGHAGDYEFDVGAKAPVERINLDLPALNSVVGAAVFSRGSTSEPWRSLRSSVFYRLTGTGGVELHNGALNLPRNADRYWLVRIAPPANSLGTGTLTLEVQWRPHELTFLARGGGPYQLAFGSAAIAKPGPMFDSLPAGAPILDSAPGAVHVLGGVERLQPPPTPFPWRTTILWAVLALGVALLAAMAYRLSKSMGSAAG